MNSVRYVEVENFNVFGATARVDLTHPAVLIGPNNSGKTTGVQALAMWSRGIRVGSEKKGKPRRKEPRERLSAGINRMSILEVPVSETRFLWNGMRVRKENEPIRMRIKVGVEHEGLVKDCRMESTRRDIEIIYCRPCAETLKDEKPIAEASGISFHLLYSMSGIETVETLLPEGRVNVLLGQGQTAQVLRKLCYRVLERDGAREVDGPGTGNADDTEDDDPLTAGPRWLRIHQLMRTLLSQSAIDVPLRSTAPRGR